MFAPPHRTLTHTPACTIPVDAATIIHWASATKCFIAVAIMQLRDAGQLSLDDPVAALLPGLLAVHNPFSVQVCAGGCLCPRVFSGAVQ